MNTTIIRKFRRGVEVCRFALAAALTFAAVAALPSFADGIRWEQPKNITGDADVRTDSIQLRDVTPGQIEWEEPKDITDDSDVRTEGETVFAACWSGTTSVVNNVVFVPHVAPETVLTKYHDIRMTVRNLQWYRTAEFINGVTQTISDDYHRLMGGATYISDTLEATMTFEGLTPGGRYLVQLWCSDGRSNIGPYRYASIDCGRRVRYKSGTYGQHITGVFTADGSEKSLVPGIKAKKLLHVGSGQTFDCVNMGNGVSFDLPSGFKADANADVFKIVRPVK